MTLLLALLACRGADPSASTPTPSSLSTLPTTQPTGETPIGHTGETATTVQPTSVTGVTGATGTPTADTSTSETGLATTGLTGATGYTSLTGDSCMMPMSTGDTAAGTVATGNTGDSGQACGALPMSWELLPDDPCAVPDPGVTCPEVGSADTGTTDLACPQIDWVLHGTGFDDQEVVDVLPMSNGDLMVVGIETAGVLLGEGRPDEVFVPPDCSSSHSGWYARLAPDGTIRWADRLTDSCSLASIQGTRGVPLAHGVLIWGKYQNSGITVAANSSNPLEIPGPGPSDTHQFWALVGEDGTPLTAGAIKDPSLASYRSDVKIDDMTAGPDGSIYAGGTFEGGAVFNHGEPDEFLLTVPDGAINVDRMAWLAAWNPDGTLRWARTEGELYSGVENPRGNSFKLNGGGRLDLEGDRLRIFSTADFDMLFDACGPYETYARTPDWFEVFYDTQTGDLLGAPTFHRTMNIRGYEDTPHGQVFFGRTYENGQVGGIQYPEEEFEVVYVGDSYGVPSTQIPRLSGYRLTTEAVDMTPDFVVALSYGTSEYGVEHGWECGASLEGVQRPPRQVLQGNAMFWSAFDHDMNPRCMGFAGGRALHSEVSVAIDGEGGIVLGYTMEGIHTLDEGGPNEVEITTDTKDAIIIRLAPP